MNAPTIWDVAARSGSAFPATLTEQFNAWLATSDGQRVYREVVRRAQALRRSGIDHYGIASLWEAIRYDWTVGVGADHAGFRVNNSYRSLMARRVMTDYPDLEGFFETRTLRAA